MGTNCAPLLIADLLLFCYEKEFMASLSYNNEAEIIQAFNSISRYLNDLLNIDNPFFENMMGWIYPSELQINKANASDIEAPIFLSTFIYSKRICFIQNLWSARWLIFPFWMGTFSVLPLTVFTFLNLFDLLECLVMWLTSMYVIKLVNFSVRAIGIINFEKLFSKYYLRHYELVLKFKVGLKSLLPEGLLDPEFYCDLV